MNNKLIEQCIDFNIDTVETIKTVPDGISIKKLLKELNGLDENYCIGDAFDGLNIYRKLTAKELKAKIKEYQETRGKDRERADRILFDNMKEMYGW